MTAVKSVRIRCDVEVADGCAMWFYTGWDTTVQAREAASKAGWQNIKGKDWCPACVAMRAV
jgi:hypothetical protein